MTDVYSIFRGTISQVPLKILSNYLNVDINTIRRWKKLENIPPQYYFDLCRFDGLDINYNKFSYKEKDQFYTPISTAQHCIDVVETMIDTTKYMFIDPSAGDGAFFNLLPTNRRIGIDIEPRTEGIISTDFLLWKPDTTNNICIGNPPFGLRGNLALRFINHASSFCDYVCFILPQLFNSDGKGSCKKRVNSLGLIHTEKIDSNFYYPDNKEVNVNVIFQIWSKFDENKKSVSHVNGIKIYSLSDGGTPATTRNKSMLYNCDYYLPSTCFGRDCMRLYDSFKSLPQKRGYGIKVIDSIFYTIIPNIKWCDVAFVSTNGAYNLRVDLINKAILNINP